MSHVQLNTYKETQYYNLLYISEKMLVYWCIPVCHLKNLHNMWNKTAVIKYEK